MSLTPLVEVAISLAVLYLFFSQIASGALELLAGFFNARGNYLREWLNKALNSGHDKNWAELLYRHPSVDMLARSESRPPAYVPSSVFAKAIVDLVIDEARTHQFRQDATAAATYQATDPPGTPLQQLRAGLALISAGDFKSLLMTTLLNAEGCSRPAAATPAEAQAGDAKVFDQFVHGLAMWYDNYMDRVSGWYKRRVRWGLLGLGALLAWFCNLDSIYVARYFWQHNEARQRVAAYAETLVKQPKPAGAAVGPGKLRPTSAADSLSRRRATAAPRPAAAPDSVARRLLARTDSLTRALQELEYPIGWTAAVDSAALPDTLAEYHPVTEQRAGWWWRTACYLMHRAAPPATWRPAYWVRYVRWAQASKKAAAPAAKKAAVAPAVLIRWRRDTLLHLPPGRLPALRPAAAAAPNLAQPWGLTLLGWAFTAVALSFGAPFWFELLNRFVNMRSLGAKPPTAQAAPTTS